MHFLVSEIPIYNPQLTIYFSPSLLSPNVYSNLLICKNDVYLNPKIFPKPKIGLLSYNPQYTLQPTVYLSPCLVTLNVTDLPE